MQTDAPGTNSEAHERGAALSGAAAEARADDVLARVDLSTDLALDDRLAEALGDAQGAQEARDLANDAHALYNLLVDLRRSTPGVPVNPVVLRKCLVLALTRPTGTPIWDDYQAYLGTIEHAWAAAGPGAGDAATWAPTSAARARFRQTWGE